MSCSTELMVCIPFGSECYSSQSPYRCESSYCPPIFFALHISHTYIVIHNSNVLSQPRLTQLLFSLPSSGLRVLRLESVWWRKVRRSDV